MENLFDADGLQCPCSNKKTVNPSVQTPLGNTAVSSAQLPILPQKAPTSHVERLLESNGVRLRETKGVRLREKNGVRLEEKGRGG